MKRLLLSAVFAAFIFQVTGLTAFVSSDPCTQSCPDDGPHEKCPPFCGCVGCAAHSVQSLVATRLEVCPAHITKRRMTVLADAVPASADLAEIQHVPKLSLA